MCVGEFNWPGWRPIFSLLGFLGPLVVVVGFRCNSLAASPDPIGDLIQQIEERDQRLPSFFYRTTESVGVYTQSKGGEPIATLEKGDLIPFAGVSDGRAVINSDDYGMLFADTKGKALRKDASETSMIDVYLDVPQGQPVTITSVPGKTWRDCGPEVPEGRDPVLPGPRVDLPRE